MPGNDTETEPRNSPVALDVMDGIRSLHTRIDELHQVVAQRLEAEGAHAAGDWLHDRAGAALHQMRAIPAWQRQTQGELRWAAAIVTTVGIALQLAIPRRLVLVQPSWVIPAAQGALLVALLAANPHRINRESAVVRSLALMLATLISLANGWSLGRLAVDIVQGKTSMTAGPLLISGAVIWLTNVVVFSLWYWEFDRGGPAARALEHQVLPRLPVCPDDQPP